MIITDHDFRGEPGGTCDRYYRTRGSEPEWYLCGEQEVRHSSARITNHAFIGHDAFGCSYSYGAGADRERCGNPRERHAWVEMPPSEPEAITLTFVVDGRPLSPEFSAVDLGRSSIAQNEAQRAAEESEPLTDDDHEATKRILFHIVSTYQRWRDMGSGVPNEFTDDAIEIGEQHLRDLGWFHETDVSGA